MIQYKDAAAHYEVPQHIRYIEDLAFSGARELVSLEIPDSVGHIGNYAFRMCYSLEEITLPGKADHIGAGLFQHCWKLRRIAFPEGTLIIGTDMLESCHALTSVEIPDSVRKIDRSAFSGCRSLREIIISPGKLAVLPPAARYTAVLTYMERNAGPEGGDAVINRFISERQGNILDLAINRRSTQAVRYMLSNGLLSPDTLEGYLTRSAERNRVEITALLLEYGRSGRKTEDPLAEDPFA